MSDQTADGGQGAEGQAAPLPTLASQLPAAPTSQPASDEALFEKFLANPKFAQRIERQIQSTKDSRFATLKSITTPEGVAALDKFIKAAGNDVEKGVRDFRVDQMLQQAEQEPAPATPASMTVPGRTAAAEPAEAIQKRVSDLMTEAGINWNTDADYKALVGKSYADLGLFERDVTKLVARRARQAAQPSIGAAASDNGGSIPGNGNNQQAVWDIDAQIMPLLKSPSVNAAKLTELRARRAQLEK